MVVQSLELEAASICCLPMKIFRHWDRIALLVGGGFLVAGFALTLKWRHETAVWRSMRFKLAAAPATILSTEISATSQRAVPSEWHLPAAQSRGAGWGYEVFTPLAILRDNTSGRLALDLPEGGAPAELELIAVKREPYRLQLTGYFGGRRNYTAVFARAGTPGVILAREGVSALVPPDCISRALRKRGPAWSRTLRPRLFCWTGRRAKKSCLSCGRPKLTDVPLAVVQAGSAGSPPVELREGDSFRAMGSDYRVEHIALELAEISLTTISPDPAQIKRCVLRIAHWLMEGNSPENEPRGDPGKGGERRSGLLNLS